LNEAAARQFVFEKFSVLLLFSLGLVASTSASLINRYRYTMGKLDCGMIGGEPSLFSASITLDWPLDLGDIKKTWQFAIGSVTLSLNWHRNHPMRISLVWILSYASNYPR